MSNRLDLLASVRAELAGIEEEKENKRNKVLRPIQVALSKIEKTYETRVTMLLKRMTDLESDIRRSVVAGEETIKGERLMGVYNKPRVTYNKDMLEGIVGTLQAVNPELAKFFEKVREEADSGTCTIREI